MRFADIAPPSATRHEEQRCSEASGAPASLVCHYLPDTTLTCVSEAYCRYFALERDQLLGRRLIDLIPEPRRAQMIEHVQAVIAGAVKETVHEVAKPDGSTAYQYWTYRCVVDANGRVVEIHAVGRDVSQLSRAYDELEAQRAEVAHLTRVAILGQLSGAFAHELQQPLTAILSNAQAAQRLLREQHVDLAQVREILGDIVTDDVRMGRVIARLRALLKRRRFELKPVDVNAVVRDTLALARSRLAQSRVVVQTSLAREVSVVSGDEVQLEQVVLNLLLNAIEAMVGNDPSDRRVVLTTEQQSDRVLVSVSDNGAGFHPGAAARMFEPFATTKRDGLGLGLSICRSIVEAHGGAIWARSNAERGTTVAFAVPREAPLRNGGELKA